MDLAEYLVEYPFSMDFTEYSASIELERFKRGMGIWN